MLKFIKNLFKKQDETELEILIRELFSKTENKEMEWIKTPGCYRESFKSGNIELVRNFGYEGMDEISLCINGDSFGCYSRELSYIRNLFKLCEWVHQTNMREDALKEIRARVRQREEKDAKL